MSWDVINLANIEVRPQLQPSLGGVGLVYPGKRHVFSGPPESAKTLAAYAIAIEEIRAGGVVLLIDFEMGPHEARDRLRELGATDEDFARLHYVEPDTAATKQTMGGLLKWEPTLVIIDASAGAYELQGLDDNKRQAVEEFAAKWIDPFRFAEVATILIDHVVKNAEGRGKYAIGSERKIGSADVHLGFETVQAVRRGGDGLYRVIVHKDRLGHLHRPKAAEFVVSSHPDTHAMTTAFALATSDQAESEHHWQPTHQMEQVSRYLEEQEGPRSQTRIENAVHGRAKYVRQALAELVRTGYATEQPGAGSARLFATARPYREGASEDPEQDTPSDPVPPRPDPVPDGGADHPVPPSVPLTGTGDGADADAQTSLVPPEEGLVPPDDDRDYWNRKGSA